MSYFQNILVVNSFFMLYIKWEPPILMQLQPNNVLKKKNSLKCALTSDLLRNH